MLIAKSRAEAVEDVRHFLSLADHGQVSGGHEIRGGCGHALQGIQRAGRGADFAGGDTQISSRGVEDAMAEQQLDGAQIGAGLQQMNGERMPQRMRSDRFAATRLLKHLPPCDLDGTRRDMLLGPITWKQPFFWMGLLPVGPVKASAASARASRTVFPAFARLHPNDHPLAVDCGRLLGNRL